MDMQPEGCLVELNFLKRIPKEQADIQNSNYCK